MTATLPVRKGKRPRPTLPQRDTAPPPNEDDRLRCPCCRGLVFESVFVRHLLTRCPGMWSAW